MERQLLEIEAEIEANNERIGAMDNHMKNVEHEVKVVQVSVYPACGSWCATT
jgi:hypothetical protein